MNWTSLGYAHARLPASGFQYLFGVQKYSQIMIPVSPSRTPVGRPGNAVGMLTRLSGRGVTSS